MTGELTDQSIAVVGAGFGGLSAAAYLGTAGADVTVYEKQPAVGGVAGRLVDDGFRFDTGPSWYLMPGVFEEFFGDFGHDPAEFYNLVRLDPNYRVFWTDGDRVDVPADPAVAAELFESYEPGGGDAFDRYLQQSEEAYEIGMNRFVRPGRSRLREFLSVDVLRSAKGLRFLGTMDDHVASYFDNPKLQQLLQYTLVFLGGSPYNTPALYTLMSHVDFGLGVYYPMGGMRTVVEGVATVAREQGATVHTDQPVVSLQPGPEGIAVETTDGTTEHDRVVCNAPPAHVEQDLIEGASVSRRAGYWEDRTVGPSAFMLYLGVEGSVESLEHHTLVLPLDWGEHFSSIFDDPAWPENPAYYLNVPSQTDPAVAPKGHETVVILVPVAPGLHDSAPKREQFRDKILSDIAETTGVDLRGRIRVEHSTCVSDYASRFNKQRGTALGLAHTLGQTGPLRPGNRVPGVDRLYYVGGDANPGIGVPMCLLSGKHVAEAINEDTTPTRLFDYLPSLGRA
jgi:phytoene desaturase